MTQEKWLDLINMIEDKFQIEERKKEPLEEGPGECDTVVFKLSTGRFRLDYIRRPRVLDKKTTYSHRVGGDVKVDYIYSEDEFVAKLHAYRWDAGSDSWIEIEPEMFSK